MFSTLVLINCLVTTLGLQMVSCLTIIKHKTLLFRILDKKEVEKDLHLGVKAGVCWWVHKLNPNKISREHEYRHMTLNTTYDVFMS